MENEIWADIKGYDGLYKISNLGRVKSLTRRAKHVKGGTQTLNGRILKQNVTGAGYAGVALCRDGIPVTRSVHSLVAKTFITKNVNAKEVNHKNGIKFDNRADNLEWCTKSENRQHALKTGLSKNIGETHYRSKLNRDKVMEIRKMYQPYKLTIKELAKTYFVSLGTIQNVLEFKTWKNI